LPIEAGDRTGERGRSPLLDEIMTGGAEQVDDTAD